MRTKSLLHGVCIITSSGPHSGLDDRTPGVFAQLHGMRFALPITNQASVNPPQGFAAPAKAALDADRHLPENDNTGAKRFSESPELDTL